ncbi:MAG: MmcQ/YjbR family DNA-binding protein [Alistipes sp.]|nr:MmcQ/YjbR family DNA-binding protein [Alistipes sp.]
MDIIDLREYLLSLPLVEECQPFGDDAVVYKVGGRMFACCVLEHAERIAVKCNPDRAIVLRDEYLSAITPAWHFNKRHWNDLYFEQLPSEIVKREIRHSYLTVIRENVTPKALRNELLAIVQEAGIEDAQAIE